VAGGGVKGGSSYGETDELGHEACREQAPHPGSARDDSSLLGLDTTNTAHCHFYGGLDEKLTVSLPEIIQGYPGLIGASAVLFAALILRCTNSQKLAVEPSSQAQRHASDDCRVSEAREAADA